MKGLVISGKRWKVINIWVALEHQKPTKTLKTLTKLFEMTDDLVYE